jgi:hypothetical protein
LENIPFIETAVMHNYNWTGWSRIWFEIKRVITKLHDRKAGLQSGITSLISDQNCTTKKLKKFNFHFIIFIMVIKLSGVQFGLKSNAWLAYKNCENKDSYEE